MKFNLFFILLALYMFCGVFSTLTINDEIVDLLTNIETLDDEALHKKIDDILLKRKKREGIRFDKSEVSNQQSEADSSDVSKRRIEGELKKDSNPASEDETHRVSPRRCHNKNERSSAMAQRRGERDADFARKLAGSDESIAIEKENDNIANLAAAKNVLMLSPAAGEKVLKISDIGSSKVKREGGNSIGTDKNAQVKESDGLSQSAKHHEAEHLNAAEDDYISYDYGTEIGEEMDPVRDKRGSEKHNDAAKVQEANQSKGKRGFDQIKSWKAKFKSEGEKNDLRGDSQTQGAEDEVKGAANSDRTMKSDRGKLGTGKLKGKVSKRQNYASETDGRNKVIDDRGLIEEGDRYKRFNKHDERMHNQDYRRERAEKVNSIVAEAGDQRRSVGVDNGMRSLDKGERKLRSDGKIEDQEQINEISANKRSDQVDKIGDSVQITADGVRKARSGESGIMLEPSKKSVGLSDNSAHVIDNRGAEEDRNVRSGALKEEDTSLSNNDDEKKKRSHQRIDSLSAEKNDVDVSNSHVKSRSEKNDIDLRKGRSDGLLPSEGDHWQRRSTHFEHKRQRNEENERLRRYSDRLKDSADPRRFGDTYGKADYHKKRRYDPYYDESLQHYEGSRSRSDEKYFDTGQKSDHSARVRDDERRRRSNKFSVDRSLPHNNDDYYYEYYDDDDEYYSENKDVHNSRNRRDDEGGEEKEWGPWSEWSPCTKSCGEGQKIQWRHCIKGACLPGDRLVKVISCSEGNCEEGGSLQQNSTKTSSDDRPDDNTCIENDHELPDTADDDYYYDET